MAFASEYVVRVSAKAEYACVAMVELAARHGTEPVQIKTIAEGHGISPGFLVQILLQLKGAGLVTSSRGASGGYQLTRRPEEINLADVISAIDPTPLGQSALTGLHQSPVVQTLRHVWQVVSRAEQEILEGTSLADMVQRSRGSDLTWYQI